MAHHNFYDSLGLDRSKDADTLGKEIDQRLKAPSLSDAARDELQVARRILGDSGRRKIYDTRLDDPAAPTIDVPALRQMAAADPDSGAAGTNSASKPKRKKPKQYFPDTNPNAEAVRPGQTAASPQGAPEWNPSFTDTTSIPVYQGPAPTGQFPGQYSFPGQLPGQPRYQTPGAPGAPGVPGTQAGQQGQAAPTAPTAQTGQAGQTSQLDQNGQNGQAGDGSTAAPAKKGASPWLVGAIVVVLLAIAAGGWWLWSNQGEEWNAEEQQMADTFPQIISKESGQKGWLGMKCESMPATNGEEARIRCSDSKLGVSIMDYGSESNRDAQLPEGDAEVIGNNVCSARSYKMEGVTPPAYRIAPEGADAQYLLVVNGGEAESKRMYLNLCEKSRG